MELHGSLADNLSAAIRSARRLQGHRVHQDTVKHWNELLHFARRGDPELIPGPIRQLMAELETELARHHSLGGG
jgi:hypothetical protein